MSAREILPEGRAQRLDPLSIGKLAGGQAKYYLDQAEVRVDAALAGRHAGMMTVMAFWTAGQLLFEKAYILLVFAGVWTTAPAAQRAFAFARYRARARSRGGARRSRCRARRRTATVEFMQTV
jgi:hypothetical protein